MNYEDELKKKACDLVDIFDELQRATKEFEAAKKRLEE